MQLEYSTDIFEYKLFGQAENKSSLWAKKDRNGFWSSHIPPFPCSCYSLILPFSVLVPVGYFLIYRFRKKDNYHVSGLNERSRLIRRHKNIVSTQFNMMNWIFEMSGFIVLIPGSNTFYILYFLFTCTISPVLYYAGILKTRNAEKPRALAIFRELKRRKILNKSE